MTEKWTDAERLKKAGKLLALSLEALQAHMNLIQEPAQKNSAKGDMYWGVYSQGLAVMMMAQQFMAEDLRQ